MLSDTYLYQEIHQQTEVIQRFLKEEVNSVKQLAQEILKQNINYVVIAARGTSDNAGRYAQYVLGALNRLPVALATPSLFSIYKKPPNLSNALVLGISQSGMSPDIIAVVQEAKRQGALTAVITNAPESELAKYGDYVINLNAGVEKAVAATKTYTVELAAIALLSTNLADSKEMKEALQLIPEAVSHTLNMKGKIARIAPRYRYLERSVVIGRGYNYATAFELALKMEELTYKVVEPYSSADFLHGPMAMIEPGFPIIVIAPEGEMTAKFDGFIDTLNDRHAEVICISDVETLLSKSRIPLLLPSSLPEWLSPITAIIPGQLLSMYMAYERDFDVDSPRGLRKVTRTH